MNPPWGPSMLPSPSATLPPSSPLSSAPLQRPLSRGNPPLSADRHGAISSPGLPGPSHLPPLSRERLPPRSPRQYRQTISTPPYTSTPGPTTHPANSPIRLPPIPPTLSKLKVDFSASGPHSAGSVTTSPWSMRMDKAIDNTFHPISPLTQEDTGVIERRWSHEQSSYSLPPIRQCAEALPRQRCFSTSAMIPAGHRDILSSPTVSEGAIELPPVKRRKMELGEMVNA